MYKTIILLILSSLLTTVAQARDPDGRYSQVDPKLKKWFEEQTIPGTNRSCCSQADGATAEEDIRGNDYWVKFEAEGFVVGWMKVPASAVLDTPNLRGVPVAWWGKGEEGEIVVRCYSPGPKT